MADQTCFVQFPHPGPEHAPHNDAMPWNRGDHRRKFMRSSGTYLDGDVVRRGPFTWWGEWEPASSIVHRFARPVPGMPRVVHEPLPPVPPDELWRQNTDPYVLGDRMLYSNCRQQQNAKLRSLGPGSVIAFGSKVQGEFVLDTLLVVSESSDFAVGMGDGLDWSPSERVAIAEPLLLDGNLVGRRFRRYEGAPWSASRKTMFSFVPCRPWAEDGAPFRRPALRLDPQWVTPGLTQNARVTPAGAAELEGLWDSVRRQVVDEQGLCLAVHIDAP